MALAKLLVSISGTRNGEDWPRAGSIVELPDDECAQLVQQGNAVLADLAEEQATASEAGVETAVTTKRGPRAAKNEGN